MTDDMDDTTWLTVPEAQDYLRVSKTTLYNFMQDGRLPFYYLKGTRQRRVRRTDLDALLEPGHPEELDASDEDQD